MKTQSTILLGVLFLATHAVAVALAQAPATQPADLGIDKLRSALLAAYRAGDVDALLPCIHPDAVIIFPDGRILKGREDLRAYYHRMMTGPDRVVGSCSAEPVVQSRTVHNDVGLSYGLMNDKYVLTDGTSFVLDSRFTVTLFKSPDGPADTDGWMVRSFHSSTSAFDNDVLKMVARSTFWRAGIGGLVIGAIVGWIVGRFRKPKPAA